MIYFKDLAHHYGLSYEEMELVGDVAVWEFIVWNRKIEEG